MSAAFLVAARACAFAPATALAATVVHGANDVCAAEEDPCVIDRALDVAPGALLDFGLRRVRIQGSGLLDFGAGDSVLRSGALALATAGTAMRVRGPSPAGGSAGGRVAWTVQGHCAADATRACLFDTACAAAGPCAGGDADLGGAVAGDADAPGQFVLTAAGDVTVLAPLSLAATRASSDGGSVGIESTRGSVFVSAALTASGGGASSGGSVELLAARDVVVAARIEATGGEYDGGAVAIDAGRDVLLREDLRVDATAGGGFGGELDAVAGRDLLVEGGTAANNLVIRADGHQSAYGSGGDGGTVNLDAGGNLAFSRHARIEASGAAPDGFADEIALTAGASLRFDGTIVARGRGSFGGGGLLDFASGAAMTLAEGAGIDLSGPAAGGDLVLESDGDLDARATVDVAGGAGGVGGRVLAVAAADARIGGRWSTGGADSALSIGELFIEGCRVAVGGELANQAGGGLNRIVARERFTLEDGAALSAGGAYGSNRILYRSAAKPPLLRGAVTPAPVMFVDPTLHGCPVCGNGELDGGESCDDGNLAGGDGCSPRCQDEGCEAGTPGAGLGAGTALCDDDSECTVDRCDAAAHACVHDPFDCSDGLSCTDDRCEDRRCVHVGVAARCDDANACTDDSCSTSGGCVHAANDVGCDDGLFCNGADRCAGGLCSLHAGDPCRGGADCADTCTEAAASCLAPAGRACAGDGNACTVDACDGAGACVHASTMAACADDGNACTDDRCDVTGACAHPPLAAGCDDGDPCTPGDSCRDGGCPPRPQPLLEVTAMKGSTKGGGPATVTAVATLPLSLLPASPEDEALRVLLFDAFSRPLLDAVLAAGVLRGGGGAWRYRAAGDAGPGGIRKAALDVDAAAGLVRVKLRVSGGDAASLATAPGLAMALLFGDGDVPASCASSAPLACEAGKGGLRCATPREPSAPGVSGTEASALGGPSLEAFAGGSRDVDPSGLRTVATAASRGATRDGTRARSPC